MFAPHAAKDVLPIGARIPDVLGPPGAASPPAHAPDDPAVLIAAYRRGQDLRALEAVWRWAARRAAPRVRTLARESGVPVDDLEAAAARAFSVALKFFDDSSRAPFAPHFDRWLRQCLADEAARFGRLSGESRHTQRERRQVGRIVEGIRALEASGRVRAAAARRSAPPALLALPALGSVLDRAIAGSATRASRRAFRAAVVAALDACDATLTAGLPGAPPADVVALAAACVRDAAAAFAARVVRCDVLGSPPARAAAVDVGLHADVAAARDRYRVWGRRAVTDPGNEFWAEVAARALMSPDRARLLYLTGGRALRLDAPVAGSGPRDGTRGRGEGRRLRLADVVSGPDGPVGDVDDADDASGAGTGLARVAAARTAFARLLPSRQLAFQAVYGISGADASYYPPRRLREALEPAFGMLLRPTAPVLREVEQTLGASLWVLAAAVDAPRVVWNRHPAQRAARRVRLQAAAWARDRDRARDDAVDAPPPLASTTSSPAGSRAAGRGVAAPMCTIRAAVLVGALHRLGLGGLGRGRPARLAVAPGTTRRDPAIVLSLAWWEAGLVPVAHAPGLPGERGVLLVTVQHAARGSASPVVGTTAIPAARVPARALPDGAPDLGRDEASSRGSTRAAPRFRGPRRPSVAGREEAVTLGALADGRALTIGRADARAVWAVLAHAGWQADIVVAGVDGGLALAVNDPARSRAWAGPAVVPERQVFPAPAGRLHRPTPGVGPRNPAPAVTLLPDPDCAVVRAADLVRVALRVAAVAALGASWDARGAVGRDAAAALGSVMLGVEPGAVVALAGRPDVLIAYARVIRRSARGDAIQPRTPSAGDGSCRGLARAPGSGVACTVSGRVIASLAGVFAPNDELALRSADGTLALAGADATLRCPSDRVAPPGEWPVELRSGPPAATLAVRALTDRVRTLLRAAADTAPEWAVTSRGSVASVRFGPVPRDARRAVLQFGARPGAGGDVSAGHAVVVVLAALAAALSVVPAIDVELSLGALTWVGVERSVLALRPARRPAQARPDSGSGALTSSTTGRRPSIGAGFDGEDAWSAVAIDRVTDATREHWRSVPWLVV